MLVCNDEEMIKKSEREEAMQKRKEREKEKEKEGKAS